MRAITIDAYKARPQLQEIPRPQPGEEELLIRLHADGVNPMDCKARDGSFQSWMPAQFPAVLGFDGAGVVEQVGAGVSSFRPGDDVFGQFMSRVLHWGTYADYVVASASGAIVPKPDSLDYVQAAALPRATWSAPSTPSIPKESMPCWMWSPPIRRAWSISARSCGPVADS
jgi:NADPH:quinone reductase-like Zn-dependent oxidoreductase